jgi:hypothetical protein
MTNGDLVPRDRQAWFAEMLTELETLVSETEWHSLTQADPRILHRSFQGLKDFVDLLRTESEMLQGLFENLANLVYTLRAQRDEALAERDAAASHYQEAYLRRPLTHEAEPNKEWSTFGVTETFRIDWLTELLNAAGEREAASKVAWVMLNLSTVTELASAHQKEQPQSLDTDSLP